MVVGLPVSPRRLWQGGGHTCQRPWREVYFDAFFLLDFAILVVFDLGASLEAFISDFFAGVSNEGVWLAGVCWPAWGALFEDSAPRAKGGPSDVNANKPSIPKRSDFPKG